MVINGVYILVIVGAWVAYKLGMRFGVDKRRCGVVGCRAFPDAAWHLCAEHLEQIEADIEADYAAMGTDREVGSPDA